VNIKLAGKVLQGELRFLPQCTPRFREWESLARQVACHRHQYGNGVRVTQ